MKAAPILILLYAIFIPLSTAKSLPWIVNGTETTIEKHPYQVIIEIILNDGTKTFCGGSLIAKNFVLTAAHCESDDAKYVIYFASTIRFEGPSRVVSQWISHEKYDEETIHNDIALAAFKEEIAIGPNVNIVTLAKSTNLEDGTLLTATGWGLKSVDGDSSEVLMEVELPVFNFEKCQMILKDVIESQICLGGEDKDVCTGDSGGPAVKDGVQYGITSYGIGCATPSMPGVYTRVSSYYDWIMRHVNNKTLLETDD